MKPLEKILALDFSQIWFGNSGLGRRRVQGAMTKEFGLYRLLESRLGVPSLKS